MAAKKASRKIHLISDVSDESFLKFCRRMSYLEDLSHKEPIYVELSSPGGSAYDALAFSARIRNSPCDVIITAYGLVASAAVLILAAGDKRRMAEEAWVMVHEDSGEVGGDVTSIAKQCKQYETLEDQWAELLEKLTDVDAKNWRKLHHDTTYMTAQECLEYGLVDEIF